MLRGAAIALGIICVVAAAAIATRGLVAARTPAEAYLRQRGGRTPLPVLWSAPAFDLVRSDGAHVTRDDLLGKVWIASFLFAGCTSVCPVMTAKLSLLQRQLGSGRLRFVSVSVDPEHDSPAALRAYAAHWPSEPRWFLLSATQPQLDDFARGLRVAVAPGADERDPIIHSKLLTLVDERGRVRGVYDGDDSAAWTQLAEDATALLGQEPATTSAGDGAGSALQRFGCAGCHDRPAVAPGLGGLGGRMVALASGEQVRATPAYLRASILRPSEQLVAGYPALMPSYAGVLSDEQVEALVAEMAAKGGIATLDMAAPSPGPAEDPVCHMKVATVDPNLSLIVEGARYHFCSARCLARFREQQSAP